MKKTFFSLIFLATALGLMAQNKPAKVESPLVTEKDFVWYVEQTAAWKDVVSRQPQDETAWRNYYTAARYIQWYNRHDTTATQVLREMQQVIPDSYTFNFCAYRATMQGHWFCEGDENEYAEAALARLPDEMQMADYDIWVCYLAKIGDDTRMQQLAKRYFDSGLYSEAVLRYNYNELAGMDNDGIYIGNGDVTIIPKWLIQNGMNQHRDKTIVCVSFLVVKEYREWLFQKLDIALPELKEAECMEDFQANERVMLQAIIDKYGSKVYFSPLNPAEMNEPWKQNLYNEGLLLKYSKKSYDNLAVKRRNVEERYMMEYLLQTFRPDWSAGQHLSANYAVMLADLLPYYAKHDRKRYVWLMQVLAAGVTNTTLPEEHKQEILKLLM